MGIEGNHSLPRRAAANGRSLTLRVGPRLGGSGYADGISASAGTAVWRILAVSRLLGRIFYAITCSRGLRGACECRGLANGFGPGIVDTEVDTPLPKNMMTVVIAAS